MLHCEITNLFYHIILYSIFKLPCKAIGVLPPLQFSSNVINFAATAINDTCTTTIFVENNHLDKNQFTHPVPRIGNGPVADVGPTSFEFVIPEDCPITISPNIGTVTPGQRLVTEVRFSPRLPKVDIEEECQRIAIARQETKRKEEERRAADLLRQEMEENAHVCLIYYYTRNRRISFILYER